MRRRKLTILVLLLSVLLLAGCSTSPAPPNPLPSATVPRSETPLIRPTPVPSVTPAASLPPPSATPEKTPTATATPAPMTAVKEEDGWVTYRNEIVGYEISVPNSYQIIGYPPGSGFTAHGLLGPAVPDEEIDRLLARYYGGSLDVWIREPDPSGQLKDWSMGIHAYDILVNTLGADIGLGGIGDYELTRASETLTIDGQAYEVGFTVLRKNNQAVQELGVLYLEKDGIRFHFGYFPEKDDPETYQAYRKEVWPVLRRIIESYRHVSISMEPDPPETVINAYMEALEAKRYDVAYTYFSVHANKPGKDDYVAFSENLYASIKLLSIQTLADWQAENNYRVVKDPENIRRFLVKYEVRYQEGRFAAAPEGIWSRVFVMIKKESQWRILSEDIATSRPYRLPTTYSTEK